MTRVGGPFVFHAVSALTRVVEGVLTTRTRRFCAWKNAIKCCLSPISMSPGVQHRFRGSNAERFVPDCRRRRPMQQPVLPAAPSYAGSGLRHLMSLEQLFGAAMYLRRLEAERIVYAVIKDVVPPEFSL